jgi:hypothetical protein
MNALLSPANSAAVEVTSATAMPDAPVRRRRKAIAGALLLGLMGAIGFNVYVFANAPRNTPSFGLSDVLQVYAQKRTLDEQRPAPLD